MSGELGPLDELPDFKTEDIYKGEQRLAGIESKQTEKVRNSTNFNQG